MEHKPEFRKITYQLLYLLKITIFALLRLTCPFSRRVSELNRRLISCDLHFKFLINLINPENVANLPGAEQVGREECTVGDNTLSSCKTRRLVEYHTLVCLFLQPERCKLFKLLATYFFIHKRIRKSINFRDAITFTQTRMHSSRMRTARLLTVSQHALPGGVPAGGVPAQGRCTCQWGVPAQGGVYLPGGCTCPGVVPA